jgi:hypothetical protein
VVPNLSGKGPKDSIDVNLAMKVCDAPWKHETILDTFIKKNPSQLSPNDLMILETWKYHRQGQFIIFKVLKKHAIFISQDKRADVFAVKGLYSSFEEMLGPYIPALIETVLLPFGNEIITDGIFQSYNLMFGSGIRGKLKEIYDDAKERDSIITTLLPNQEIQTRESLVEKADLINKRVVDAFSKYQYKSGRNPKTVERDMLTVTHFTNFLLSGLSEPASLREFQTEAIERFLLSVPEKDRKPIIVPEWAGRTRPRQILQRLQTLLTPTEGQHHERVEARGHHNSILVSAKLRNLDQDGEWNCPQQEHPHGQQVQPAAL